MERTVTLIVTVTVCDYERSNDEVIDEVYQALSEGCILANIQLKENEL